MKGTCDTGDNPAAVLDIWGWSELENNCLLEESGCDLVTSDYFDYDDTCFNITTGTCSAETESLLQTDACKRSMAEQPNIIKNTLELLVRYSCPTDLYYNLLDSYGSFLGPRGKRTKKKEKRTTRLAPVNEIDLKAGTKTELNYTNTLHRYPWICSLRTKGITAKHLCAVTLLSLPPQPSIIVGPAHCTYLCKDGDSRGARLDACCCTPGPLGCSDDILRCGKNPGTAEMDPNEVVILCGEWDSGPAPKISSGEKYNIPLEISEIVRHPDFGADSGVDGGSDIAVFKVSETGQHSAEFDEHSVNPICLPEPSRPIRVTGVSNGMAGGADLLLQGNRSLQTAPREVTICRGSLLWGQCREVAALWGGWWSSVGGTVSVSDPFTVLCG